MLKPIRHIECSAALAACQQLMQRFALWLCNPQVNSAHVTRAYLIKNMPSKEEAVWLDDFLQKKHKKTSLKTLACILANLDTAEKKALRQWIFACASLSRHFQPAPVHTPLPTVQPFESHTDGKNKWLAFKTLMDAFYERGFREGLPYLPNGKPTANKSEWFDYESFRSQFRRSHKLDADLYAREICVICGGELHKPSVDHWVGKAAYPLLSVCADNLVPICAQCNESPNKGAKDVHADGSFNDWFHPYKRHPQGLLQLSYKSNDFCVTVTSADPAQTRRVENLDRLFNLQTRWTREFKAEYCKVKKAMLKKKQFYITEQKPLSLKELYQWIQEWHDGLIDSEPHYEVHKLLAEVLLDPVRTVVWLAELNDS